MRFLIGVALTLLVGGSEGFWWHWGRCPTLNVEQQFNLTKYLGHWFEQKVLDTDFIQGRGRCGLTNYLNRSGLIIVNNTQISFRTNDWEYLNGTAVQVDPSTKEGKLMVYTIFEIWGYSFNISLPYFVLGTDYKSYSVVYSCKRFLFWHTSAFWCLSRTQDIDGSGQASQYNDLVNKVLNNNNMDLSSFSKMDQTNCPNPPED